MGPRRDLPSRPPPRAKDLTSPQAKSTSAFLSSKRDKRQIKHSSFVSKIAKDQTKKQRKRRPNKKLVATLDSLADALPDVEDGTTADDIGNQVNIIKHRSVKTRPGAMKRKEKLERGERDRFTKNLAEMSRPTVTGVPRPGTRAPSPSAITKSEPTNATMDRWKALRNFISQTMERLPEPVPAKV